MGRMRCEESLHEWKSSQSVSLSRDARKEVASQVASVNHLVSQKGITLGQTQCQGCQARKTLRDWSVPYLWFVFRLIWMYYFICNKESYWLSWLCPMQAISHHVLFVQFFCLFVLIVVVLFDLIWCFKIWSCRVAQASLELIAVFLSQLLQCWGCEHAKTHLVCISCLYRTFCFSGPKWPFYEPCTSFWGTPCFNWNTSWKTAYEIDKEHILWVLQCL